jgi:hypothetical protein
LLVGPVIGDQVYDHVPHGWSVVCFICAGVFGLASVVSFFFAGADPMRWKLSRMLRARGKKGKILSGMDMEATEGSLARAATGGS